MRYVYLGTPMTDPKLKGMECDPARRADGKVVRGGGKALVVFADGSRRVVAARRLRLTQRPRPSR
jgi:hypothetical protein